MGIFQVVKQVGTPAYMLYLSGKALRVHDIFHVLLQKPHNPGGVSVIPPNTMVIGEDGKFEIEGTLRQTYYGRFFPWVKWL